MKSYGGRVDESQPQVKTSMISMKSDLGMNDKDRDKL